MKRYDVTTVTDDTGCFGAMEEIEDGEWVYYGDAQAEIDRVTSERAHVAAELSGVLESTFTTEMDLRGKVEALEAENTRLRAALGWYADPENWRDQEWGIVAYIPAENERGMRARAALKENSK